MLLPAFIIALLAWPALVLSLSIELTPKQRNVTRGATTKFHYKPKDQIATNVTVLDTLTNKTYHVIDNAVNGTVDWMVPDDLDVRGGYFYVATRKVNNATITVTSASEFQVLDKPKPKPNPKPSKSPEHNSVGAMSPSMGTVGSTLLVGLGLLGFAM
ncbi:hypothetical protein P171DRAFT_431703 [Karstenula rhodostoma CBS 690.94]|uniref:Uncharacterized protein n=1 Tax=Karstenula rhodostoma CBS 690.94 TaxID=1392251 RepID=A0A9P4UC73_9PLEO|nr:hypothetical protein P171DRAFT_431703 [Karstenula rhodostoma CBS 690.94]